ncbi:maleylpyruvate isomerase N-terminal domain-containing protein [Actinoplanes sp. NPDC051470]|uniref:maleylpyruvate isomerase N-terminal domain-containing protein n=1 Tax=Actinoplanes sp. NPDC051470 TaxID=3157224 RepID=UPI00343FD506
MLTVLDVLRGEVDALIHALGDLPAAAWERPTRCAPWLVKDVVGHLVTTMSRLPGMIAGPAPTVASVTAADYYRAGSRFAGDTDADRIESARRRAASADPATLVEALSMACHESISLGANQLPARVVQTRHGDAMLLSEFLSTRVVELGLHGLDIADAAARPPWITAAATDHLLRLLFPDTAPKIALLRLATGRGPENRLTFGPDS